ncbi:MAG: ECF transporter S component [Methanobacteriota archaeon]|nr:MAG: ECF transporter S component [Euryarchaeota archaeon]
MASAQDGVPVADAGADITIEVGEVAVFDGTGSTDDVGIVNYTWNFTYDDEMQLLYGATPEFEFWTVGDYDVSLTVRDVDGHNSTDLVRVIVEKNFLMKYWPFLLLGAIIAVVVLQAVLSARKKAFVSPKNVARYGVLTALVTAVTVATFVPFSPTKGYFNVGDAMVFFSALTFTWRMGGICGGFGSAAADILLGSGFFAPLTLVAKGSEGAVCGVLCKIKGGHKYAIVLGIVVGGACMVLTYFVGELLLLNVGLGAALAEAAGNTLQVVVGGTIGVVLSHSVKRAYPAVTKD